MSTEILKIDRFGKLFQPVKFTTQSLKMFLNAEKLLGVHDASYVKLMCIDPTNHGCESFLTEKAFLWMSGSRKSKRLAP